MKVKEKIVISGYYGFGNVGDEAILHVLVEELKARFRQQNLEIVVLSADPAATARRYGVRAIDRWSLPQILRELKGASAFLSGGGGLIQDATSRRSALYYLSLIALARRRCPVFLVGQGLGPLRSPWLYRWAKRLLRNAEFAMVRDEPSFKLLQHWGLARERLALGGDLTWLLWPRRTSLTAADVPKTENSREPRTERPFVAVALKGPRARRRRGVQQLQSFQEALAGQLDRLSEELDVRVVFLAFHPREDLALSEAIAARMERPTLVLRPAEPREALRCVGGARALIGMRLHALLFAALTGRPFVALSEEPKVESFLQSLERAGGPALPHWTTAQLEGQHVDLAETVAQFETRRRKLEEGLARAGEALYAQTRRALDACWAHLERALSSQS